VYWARIDQLDEAARLHRQAISNAKEHHVEALDESARLGWDILEEEIALSRELHAHAIKQQQQHFEYGRDITLDHFERARVHVEELHKQQLGFSLRTHTHQIQVAHESARRENVRDVWIQKVSVDGLRWEWAWSDRDLGEFRVGGQLCAV
jgi:hypothetical protein